MIVKPAVYGEYLQWKKDNKKILGTDTWLVVRCIQCGATGPRGLTEEEAIDRWNGVRLNLEHKGAPNDEKRPYAHAYIFGKKIPGAKEPVITQEQMDEARALIEKFIPSAVNET